jgi:hypothetical protein
MKEKLVPGLIGIALGGAVASGVWVLASPKKPADVKRDLVDAGAPPPDDESLRKANESLVASLHACDRQLAELRQTAPPPTATATGEPRREERDGGRGFRRREITQQDLDRMAQLGIVRTRIPCIRDKPWTPNQRQIDRMGLAPSDVQALKEAYEASNKRVAAQVAPLCAKVVGSEEAASRIGTGACIDAINNSAKKTSPEQFKASLQRVAEVNAGKRAAPKETSDVLEQLTLSLSAESAAFEKDLAQKLGPDDAKRIAQDPSLCADRRTFRGSEEEER